MMSRDEYIARAEAEDDWAPGWDAIEAAFATQYPGVEPTHFATDFADRASLGGTQFIDGYSFYKAADDVQHLVTFGMSDLYAHEDYFGLEHSGWGYEMTMQIRTDDPFASLWATNVLSSAAEYTNSRGIWFAPFEVVGGTGNPFAEGSLINSGVFVADTVMSGIDTLHGRLEFLQFVGLMQDELNWIAAEGRDGAPPRAQELLARMAVDNPRLITDLARTKSYVP
ncbi:suppressor of fused domain protein [Gulosibacter macacae]|nr:suppressor of fused domain protein [Gulosibacter macacae]